MKRIIYTVLIVLPFLTFSQTIEITSFNENPLEISPLLGGNLQVNLEYTSQAGSAGNNLYIGLEELDENNQFVRTIAGVSLENEPAGINVQLSPNLFVGTIQPLSDELPIGHYYQVIARLYTNTWTELASSGYWNTPALTTVNNIPYNFSSFPISKGADVSWMTEMEASGFGWQDNDGNASELMPLLTQYDMNAVRLRVWVNPDISPANGWCDIEDMVNKAILANNEGMDLMVCIHFSDYWADPGQQNKPAAWTNMSVSQLEAAVADHTTDILTALDAVGISPKWVQIGNETNDGMLWDTGRASTGGFANYAKFLNAGTNAVKTFDSNIQTILHLASGDNSSLYNWNIGGLINNGLVFSSFDIIGMSLYPSADDWIDKVDATFNNMMNLQATYNKEVMMVEVGFSAGELDISYQFLVYMIEKTRQANGLGVFYWEPIAHLNWKGYGKGAWDNDGSPSVAMNAFLNTSTLDIDSFDKKQAYQISPNPSSQIINIYSPNQNLNSIEIYNLNGKLMNQFKSDELVKSINISELSAGIYFARINSNKTIKFIKN